MRALRTLIMRTGFSARQSRNDGPNTQNLLYLLCPERGGPSREFGYLARSSARTRITRATTNRQSMAMLMATRVQDDFSSNRPHLLCVGTARRSFSAACGPTIRPSGSILRHRFPRTQRKRDQFIDMILIGSVRAVTRVGRVRFQVSGSRPAASDANATRMWTLFCDLTSCRPKSEHTIRVLDVGDWPCPRTWLVEARLECPQLPSKQTEWHGLAVFGRFQH